jgi:hypothetical protein
MERGFDLECIDMEGTFSIKQDIYFARLPGSKNEVAVGLKPDDIKDYLSGDFPKGLDLQTYMDGHKAELRGLTGQKLAKIGYDIAKEYISAYEKIATAKIDVRRNTIVKGVYGYEADFSGGRLRGLEVKIGREIVSIPASEVKKLVNSGVIYFK